MPELHTDGFISHTPASDHADLTAQRAHPSGDPVLGVLMGIPGAIGDLIRAFPGRQREGDLRWLDEWFRHRTEERYAGGDVAQITPVAPATIAEADRALSDGDGARLCPTRLLTVEPHYFRGFRTLSSPVEFEADLVVLDGPNTSGKTSLAEALEWLFTGALSRRSLREQGTARELEDCIGNCFRPPGEQSWVEATLRLEGGRTVTLRRALVEDYGSTSTATCSSEFFFDGRVLNPAEEARCLEALFSGHPPLLMQHTLRLFVQSEPRDRRRYFERLLRLDELTYLVEKAVIGSRASDLRSPSGSVALSRWQALKENVRSSSLLMRMRRVEGRPRELITQSIEAGLPIIAAQEFPHLVRAGSPAESARLALRGAQQAARVRRLPLLNRLRPTRAFDQSLSEILDRDVLRDRVAVLTHALEKLALAQRAAAAVTAAQLAVAEAVALLTTAGLIGQAANDTTCPICEWPDVKTLSGERLTAIRAWMPLQTALTTGTSEVARAANDLLLWLRGLRDVRNSLLPPQPSDAEWSEAASDLTPPLTQAVASFRNVADAAMADLELVDRALLAIGVALRTCVDHGSLPNDFVDQHRDELDTLARGLPSISEHSRLYAIAFAGLERAVGASTQGDSEYARRDHWLAVAADPEAVAGDLLWERAKTAVAEELQRIRETLMGLRHQLIDRRRRGFNDGITQVWATLRHDSYSTFSQLLIPSPSGRGFPLDIEIKALLDDGTQQIEVDALRVFSESQINVLGIAAFVTRSKLLGHRLLVIDDPVQSMDEEHFRTFARDLLTHLVDNGFQVIVLTHNDTFARDVSFAHFTRVSYATISIRHAQSSGCQLYSDSRRVQERLRRADRLCRDGHRDESWTVLRYAIERLCTLIQLTHGPPDFNPRTWSDLSASDMLDRGVATIVETRLSRDRLDRLREISLLTAGGTHDTASRGQTDLMRGINELRSISSALGIRD